VVVTDEHEDIKRIRRRAADASMGFGLIAILLAVFSREPTVLPAFALVALGGLAGIGVYKASDTTLSRWFTVWSAVLTVLGIVALMVISQLVD